MRFILTITIWDKFCSHHRDSQECGVQRTPNRKLLVAELELRERTVRRVIWLCRHQCVKVDGDCASKLWTRARTGKPPPDANICNKAAG
eukprot:gene1090-biopygen18236